MHTESSGDTLRILDIPTLTSDTSRPFRDYARAALRPEHQCVEVDLSHARTVDSDGIGALISVHKAMRTRAGQVRLLQPAPLIAEMFKLLKLDHLFHIVPR
jgi:anti-anti-sigma regulatory factor